MSVYVVSSEVLLLVIMAAVCSGLNISFMSLDPVDLSRKAKLGNKAAKKVLPLRKNSHLSLASILLTNVAVISTTSLVLHDAYNGYIAGLLSTLLIVVFGEIFPQALFTKHALKYTSQLSPVLYAMIFFTYPVSKPLQLLLDALVGHEKTHLASRRELGLIITEQSNDDSSELDDDEIEIIKGALRLSEKRVRDIMTSIKNVYWLTPETIIDGLKIDEIKHNARSRIPVLNLERTNCFGILLLKDLVDVDFNSQSVVVQNLPLHKTKVVGSMTALDTLFRVFIASHTHLLPVEKDDHIIGIITIEDLIEEIIGHEIEDESDRQKNIR